ncbi:hypothetical protein [Chitinolyticbacter albus]|uniref:hypothetical protein n=1 Tax=Chitinolyticbacter albus TaxID=2961951 RepID=UPI0021086344|nr:hypothetical protein [Chitinolyticbacter albus]
MTIRTTLSLLFPALLVACATQAAGESTQLTGQLLLKGNAPHVSVVLETTDRGRWELLGLSAEQRASWQRQTVKVRGKVVRPASAQGLQLPQLQVDSVAPAQ